MVMLILSRASTVLDAYSRQKIPQGTPGSLVFRQLFEPESSTYTYLLAEPKVTSAS